MTQSLNTPDSPYFVLRSAKRITYPNEDMVRNELKTKPVSMMIALLTEENKDFDCITAAYLLLTDSSLVSSRRAAMTRTLLKMLPTDQVLKVFLALKKNRVNSKFVTRSILRYIWNHPCLNDLAVARPGILRDCLEHALGRNTVRGFVARLLQNDVNQEIIGALTDKMDIDSRTVLTVIRIIYQKLSLTGNIAKSTIKYKSAHLDFRRKILFTTPEFKTVTVNTRGDISASLISLYQGSSVSAVWDYMIQAVEKIASRISSTTMHVAMVLDHSTSTRGDGQREFACIAQSVALMMVLDRVCNLTVFHVGNEWKTIIGSHKLPLPAGETDLASAFLDAVESQPDLVIIVSDGYENRMHGDLNFVLKSIPEESAAIPAVFIHSMFTHKDSLEKRRPTTQLPELYFWHENDFIDICSRLFKNAEPVENDAYLQERQAFLDSLLAVN